MCHPSCQFAELADQITELAGHLNAANYRWLRLIAEFERRNGWSDGTLKSCAHWLNFKCGVALGAAREKVRVAHALPTLPKIAAAMALGELSYSKVPCVDSGRGRSDRGLLSDDGLARHRASCRDLGAAIPAV